MKIRKGILKLIVTCMVCLFSCGGLFLLGSCGGEGSSKNKVTYSFNVMGGENMQAVSVDLGTEYTLPTPAEREGYQFEGWYTTETFEGSPVTTVTAQESQTYYAKWLKLSKVTLNLENGSEKVVYAKEGENLYKALQAYVPAKDGLTFGAWYKDGKIVAETASIPSGDITLTAKYKVLYTVEIYLQNVEGTEYVLSSENTVTASDYVGEICVSEQKVAGFEENTTHADRVAEKELSATASENVFKHYFDRKTYSITFVPNHPDGTQAENVVILEKFGKNYMPNDYKAEGYCLIGWARQPSAATPEFNAYFVDTALQNAGEDFQPRQSDYFIPKENESGNIRLYGVWAKGYVDMFGGDDYLYLFEEEGEKIVYLSRGNVFFKGEYDEKHNEFFFMDESDDIILEGKFYSENTFAYYSEKRSGYVAYLYSVGTGLDETVSVEFDNANGITYKVAGEKDTVGTQKTNEKGEFVADFTGATEGYLQGKTLTFITSTYGGREVFIEFKQEECDLGTLRRFYYNQAQNEVVTYQNGMGDITLDGYGLATYVGQNQNATNYYYTYEDGVITLNSQYGGEFGRAIVTTIQGETGYVMYTKWQDAELKVEGGGVLTLDGGLNATYTKDSKTITGYYSAEDSLFGGYIVKMITPSNEEITFKVKGNLDDDGVLMIGYKVSEIFNTYAEYRYLADGMVYNAVMLVIDENTQGYLTVYGFNTRTNSFVKVSEGPYVAGEEEYEGYYLYTVEKTYSCSDILTSPVNPEAVKSFVFALDSKTTSYKIFYWESSVDNNDVSMQYVDTYTCETDAEDMALKLVGGFAYYTLNGVQYSGAYAKNENGYLMILTRDATGSKTFYVAFDDDKKTFLPLEYEPYKAYVCAEDGTLKENDYLDFDGKGNATYVVEGEEAIFGSVSETTEKTNGAIVYSFLSEDKQVSFKYLNLFQGSTRVFLKYNETYNGKYEKTDARLELDGYGYYGQYRDADDNVFEGQYFVVEEDVVRLQDKETEKVFYFDLNGREFTVRSEEYGRYVWIENQTWIQETYFELNGYGKLLVYTLKEVTVGEEVEYEPEYIDENGTYTQDGDVFTLIWNGGEKKGELGTYRNTKAFLVKCDEDNTAIGLYVNDADWSVLILDDIGNAIKYGDEGEKEVGYYTFITDSLLYYVNKESTDACLYVYDLEVRTATQVKFDKTRYLTDDMETLTFYEYGFLITMDKEGNEERHYYYQDADTYSITIYVAEPENANANKYGFITKELDGGHKSTLNFEGKEYYKNDGDSLRFERIEDTKTDYPVVLGNATQAYAFNSLVFDASNDVEFRVEGGIEYNGSYVDCMVVREIDEDGNEVTYVTVGEYRFYVEFTYKGVDALGNAKSEYSVVGMEMHRVAYANSFLDSYAYYAGFGYQIENTLGEITIHGTYNKDGVANDLFVDVDFFENMNVKDSEGNLISLENAPYAYNEEEGYSYTSFVAEDGYTYTLAFATGMHKLGVEAFNIVALARQQVLTNGEYEVLTERVIATEFIRYEPGDLFKVTLKKNGETIEGTALSSNGLIQFVDGKLYYAVRTKEDGKYVGVEYYEMILESDAFVDSVEGETKVPMYLSISVAKSSMEIKQIMYSENGAYFVEFTENGVGVIALVYETLLATECKEWKVDEVPAEYLPTDSSTIQSAYLVTSSDNGRQFVVQTRNKEVEGKVITYVYVQEVFNDD